MTNFGINTSVTHLGYACAFRLLPILCLIQSFYKIIFLVILKRNVCLQIEAITIEQLSILKVYYLQCYVLYDFYQPSIFVTWYFFFYFQLDVFKNIFELFFFSSHRYSIFFCATSSKLCSVCKDREMLGPCLFKIKNKKMLWP